MNADHELSEATLDPLAGDPRLPEVFGEAWPRVQHFHDLLAEHGPLRGLIGPREVGRLWERHLLNSASVVPHIGTAGSLLDLGSGAGLPGVVIGLMEPDLTVTLLEPMARRVDWLTYVVDQLDLRNVRVVRGRAEDMAGALRVAVVTARAVASLDKLYGWAAPLVATNGLLLALKGSRAADEVSATAGAARQAGWAGVEIVESALIEGVEPTNIVKAVRTGGPRHVR